MEGQLTSNNDIKDYYKNITKTTEMRNIHLCPPLIISVAWNFWLNFKSGRRVYTKSLYRIAYYGAWLFVHDYFVRVRLFCMTLDLINDKKPLVLCIKDSDSKVCWYIRCKNNLQSTKIDEKFQIFTALLFCDRHIDSNR